MPTDYPAVNAALREESEAHYWSWFAGFIDGEGCFLIDDTRGGNRRPMPVCEITLTADARPVLEEIQQALGVGKLSQRERKRAAEKRIVRWRVCGTACEVVADVLRRYPLLGRRERDFAVWSLAVDAYVGNDNAALPALAEQLRGVRGDRSRTAPDLAVAA